MKFHFINAVWGDEYLNTFLDVCLPNQLTSGNLLAFTKDEGEYKIFTSPLDIDKIKSNDYFKALAKTIPTTVVPVDSLYTPETNFHSETDHSKIITSMTNCHRVAVEDANSEGAALVFLTPDMVLSDGAFVKMRQLALEGARIIALPSFRVDKESFVPAFMKRFKNKDGFAPAPARELVEVGLSNLHSMTKQYFIDTEYFEKHPWHLIWNIGDSGILARCSHFHPLMINPVSKVPFPIGGAIDQNYCYIAVPDLEDWHIVSDSDEIAYFDIALKDKLASRVVKRKFKELLFTTRLLPSLKPIQLKFYRTRVRVHHREIDAHWKDVEKASDEVINRMLATANYFLKNRPPYSVSFPKTVKSVVIFGTGEACLHTLNYVNDLGWRASYLVDNNPSNWGTKKYGLLIKDPIELDNGNFDLIIIASELGKKSISSQLLKQNFVLGKDFVYFKDYICTGLNDTSVTLKKLRFTKRVNKDSNIQVKIFASATKLFQMGTLYDIAPNKTFVKVDLDPKDSAYIENVFSILVHPDTSGGYASPISYKGHLKSIELDLNEPEKYAILKFKNMISEPALAKTIDEMFPLILK